MTSFFPNLTLTDADFQLKEDEDGHEYYILAIQEGFKLQILHNQSTLDEIKTLTESSEYDCNFVRELLKEILAKHEDKK